jgi:FMN-dependent NADH-azoreductase
LEFNQPKEELVSRLLHISSSPRGEDSASLQIADAFVQAYHAANPEDDIDHWDLWDGTLPAFGPAAAHAKMAVLAGADPMGEQATAWWAAKAAFERFAAAEEYLFSVPMWNAGIPYILKQFIDVVSQPGMVFNFDGQVGYTGLLTGRKAAVVYTSAVYGPGRPASFGSDFQAPYLRDWLTWTGVENITEVAFRPNLATADADMGRLQAHAEARDAGKAF